MKVATDPFIDGSVQGAIAIATTSGIQIIRIIQAQA